MAVTTIKSPTSNNIAEVDNNGQLFTRTVVMAGGDPLAVHINDSQGNALTSQNGSLNVNVVNQATVVTTVIPVSNYNEITNVSSGIETTVVSYTAPLTGTSYLQLIQASGSNVSLFTVYKSTSAFDKRYTYYTEFNTLFTYLTNNQSAPGIPLTPGETVYLKALNTGLDTCSFNGRIQVLEVTNA